MKTIMICLFFVSCGLVIGYQYAHLRSYVWFAMERNSLQREFNNQMDFFAKGCLECESKLYQCGHAKLSPER